MSVTAAVMSSDRPDSRLPHILDRLREFEPSVVRNRGNPWMTARAAWSALGPGASHHLVVQDDIRIAPGLAAAVRRLAAGFPDAAFACYAQWDTNCGFRVRMAALGGDALVEASARDWVPAQALLLPRHLCEALAAMPEDADHDDDEVLAGLLFRSRLRCRVGILVPNLVEHDDDPAVGYNSGDGVRRAACFLDGPAPWQPPANPRWDGPGWQEVSVAFTPDGVRLDWGVHVPEQPRRLRHIHLPWRLGIEHSGLSEAVVSAAAAGAPAGLSEYATACVLHGVAWRHWWRGGQPAHRLVDGEAADAALLALWRCGGAAGADAGLAVKVGRAAVRAGAELSGAVAAEEFHARLAAWFDTAKAWLPRQMWANSERD